MVPQLGPNPKVATRRWVGLATLSLALAGGGELPAQVAVLSSGIEQRQVRPGGVYVGSILLFNPTAEPQEARVYQTDYLFFADGSNRFDEPGTVPRSNAKWITYGPNRVTIPPGTRFRVEYTITVPDTLAVWLSGSYWSMLMVEGVPRSPHPASPEPDSTQVVLGVRQLVRQAIQIVTDIAGTGALQVDVANPQLLATADGGKVLQVDIANTGDLTAIPDVSVELYGEDGALKGKFAGVKQMLHPGTSVRQRIDLGALPAGTYHALVVADGGGEVFGAQYRLRF